MPAPDISINDADLILTDVDGNKITASAIIAAVETVILMKEFLEDSSLTKEFEEYKLYKKLKD